MVLHIRRMENTDIDSVYAIEAQAHRSPWSRDIIRDCMLVGYDCRVLEQQPNRTIIGYIICRYTLNTCHILNLCISPTLQYRGHGSYLLQTVLGGFAKNRIDIVSLEVRPSNTAAIHLYEKMGFQQKGVKKGYYNDVHGIEDAILFSKQT